MIVIAGGIILAVIILAFAGPIIAIIASLGFLFFIGIIIVVIGIVIYLNADFLVPIIIIGAIIFIFIAIIKSIGKKIDTKFSEGISDSNYTDVYFKVYLKYRFLRFSNQSKINYYKNLELEKNKIDNRIKKENEKRIEYANKRKLKEKEEEYQMRIKKFAKLSNDLKKLQKKINSNNQFEFSYSELSAKISVITKVDGRANFLEFSFQKLTSMSDFQYCVVGKGKNFSIEKHGSRKEIVNLAIEEIGKILAEFEKTKE